MNSVDVYREKKSKFKTKDLNELDSFWTQNCHSNPKIDWTLHKICLFPISISNIRNQNVFHVTVYENGRYQGKTLMLIKRSGIQRVITKWETWIRLLCTEWWKKFTQVRFFSVRSAFASFSLVTKLFRIVRAKHCICLGVLFLFWCFPKSKIQRNSITEGLSFFMWFLVVGSLSSCCFERLIHNI